MSKLMIGLAAAGAALVCGGIALVIRKNKKDEKAFRDAEADIVETKEQIFNDIQKEMNEHYPFKPVGRPPLEDIEVESKAIN